jgi:hypothetical protein
MKSFVFDTSPEAERVLIDVHRKMSVGQKWLQLGGMLGTGQFLHAAGVRLRNPVANRGDILREWMTNVLGVTLPVTMEEPAMSEPLWTLRSLREVIQVFDTLRIPYALSGSMASSLYGIERFTKDADITVEPFAGKEDQLIAAFGPEYYLSLSAIQDALGRHSSFNIINTSTGFKVDVFVCKDQAFEKAAMARRTPLSLPDRPEQPVVVHSPEDIVLFKLQRFRLGNESSDQQWMDILNVLKVQAGKLDECYLDHWAANLGLSDLLARARQESVVCPYPAISASST